MGLDTLLSFSFWKNQSISNSSAPVQLPNTIAINKIFDVHGFDATYIFTITSPVPLHSYSKIFIEFYNEISPNIQTRDQSVTCKINKNLTACELIADRRIQIYIGKNLPILKDESVV